MNRGVGIVITDGVGFRNFVLSDFSNSLKSNFDKVIIYSCLPIDSYPDDFKKSFLIIELEIFKEGRLTWLFRKIKELAHLYLNYEKNFGIQDNLKANRNRGFTKKGILTRVSFAIAKSFHSERWIQRYTYWQMESIKKLKVTINYKNRLFLDKPDIIFFTHQRPPFVAPMISAAEQLGIPKAAFIFSWDNLPSKGRIAGNFDYYLVWSQLMKQELLQFYQMVRPEQIHVVGTPQFEPYVMQKYHTSRKEFFDRFQIDSTKPTLCFSCGDISTSKNDELYISTIAEAIIRREIINNVNFIVRTSPAEDPVRFFELAKEYPFIIWNYPNWIYAREGHPEPWTQRIPREQDVKDLRALLEYCDVNINMCSTMSLDFMQFDKPVINPVFGDGKNGLYDDQRFLKYAHYERVAKSGAVEIVKNKSELISAINEALSNPLKASKERRKLLEIQIGRPLSGTSEEIGRVLHHISFKN